MEAMPDMRALLYSVTDSESSVKCGVHKVIVLFVKSVKRLTECFSKALIMNDLTLAKIPHHIVNIRII